MANNLNCNRKHISREPGYWRSKVVIKKDFDKLNKCLIAAFKGKERDGEMKMAILETQFNIASGKFVIESANKHIKRIMKGINRPSSNPNN